MKKAALTLFTAILMVSSTAALTVEGPANSQNLSVTPNERASYSFSLSDWQSNETGVQVSVGNNGQYFIGNFRGSLDKGSSSVSIPVIAPSGDSVKLPYTRNIKVEFQVKVEDGNTTSTRTVSKFLNITTKVPWKEVKGNTWVNESYLFNVNGGTFSVYDITENSVYLSRNNNTTKIPGGESEVINDIRITAVETTPYNFAEIRADTKKNPKDVSFSLEYNKTRSKDKQQCKLFLSTQGGTTIERGRVFSFQTVEDGSNEPVGNVYVRLESVITGNLIGKTTTDPFGYGSIQIPETLYKNHSDTQQVIARIQKKNSECQPSRRTLTLNTPYGEYIQNTAKYQLALSVDNKTTYGNITGVVQTKTGGKVDKGIIRVTRPDGTATDFIFHGRTFSYNPSMGGTYVLKATKNNYVSSSTVSVTYIADKDGDGVSNSKDKCPETKGVAANSGCPKKNVSLTVVNAEKNTYAGGTLYKNTGYSLKIVNKNGSTVDFDGKINVTSLGTTIDFQNGVTRQIVKFNSTGSYEVLLNQSEYETVEKTLTVENKPILGGTNIKYIGAGLLTLLLIAVLLYQRGNGSSLGTGKEIDDPSPKTQLSPQGQGE